MSQQIEIIDTASIPERDRIAFLRDGLRHVLGSYDLKLTTTLPPRQRFTTFVDLPVMIAHIETSPCGVRRRPDGSDDDVVLNIMVAGGDDFHTQLGRDARLRPDQAMLGLQYEPFTCECQESYSIDIVRLSRAEMALRVPNVEAAAARIIPQTSAPLALLRSYLETLKTLRVRPDTDGAAIMRQHVHDLAALAIGATRDGEEHARTGGVRAARLASIKRDVAARMTDVSYGVDTVSTRFSLSDRYIRLLFEAEGGFHAYLTRVRLDNAAQLLANPAMRQQKIIDIAFRCGFSSLATFNRAFTRQFGYSPSSVRP